MTLLCGHLSICIIFSVVNVLFCISGAEDEQHGIHHTESWYTKNSRLPSNSFRFFFFHNILTPYMHIFNKI